MKETLFKSDTAIDMVISQHTQPTRRPLKQPAPSISRPSRRTQAPQAADAHTVAEAVHDTSTFLEACPAAPATPFKVAVEGVAPVPDTPLQAPATTSCAKQGTAGIEPNEVSYKMLADAFHRNRDSTVSSSKGDSFQGNKFVDGLGNIQSKIKENDNIIILYNVTITEEMGIVHSTIITKSDLKFAKTISALENIGGKNFPQRIKSESINGACTVTM